jgi:hypothetical protein
MVARGAVPKKIASIEGEFSELPSEELLAIAAAPFSLQRGLDHEIHK